MRRSLYFLLMVIGALFISESNADTFFTPISPAPGDTIIRGDGPYTIGNVFNVAGQNLMVDKLGAMDVYADGFYSPVQVGIWTGDGATLLASVTVNSGDIYIGGYRYHLLSAPLTLTAGKTYLIGALVGSGIEWFYDCWPNRFANVNPVIFVGDARYNTGDSLGAPTNSSDFAVRWAPANATFTTNGPPSAAACSVVINPQTDWGTWDGWGVSLCWWANVFGTRDDLADLVFTTNNTSLNGFPLAGLGLNIARYNVGACSSNSIDGSTMQVSPNMPAFKQMQGFWQDWNSIDPGSASWNWSADANQRAMLLKAKARGANLLELFSNSPMWWMCNNHNPSGANSGFSDNLQSWNYDQHAIYLATIAKYAQDNWGIQFNSVEAFNEPSANWWVSTGTQEGCHFASGTQASVIGYLRSELDGRGLNSVNIAASDENTYDGERATWNALGSTTQGQADRVNTHGYQYAGGRRDLLYAAAAGKKLWNSEYGESDGSGLSLAGNLNLDFHWLHPTGWCYWQALDSGGWGLIQSNPGDNWIGPANRKFFVLAQYSRHIRPGMTIIDGGDTNTVAAYDPVRRKLVIATVSYGTPQWITYNLTNFPRASGPVQSWTTVTGSGPSYQANPAIALSQRIFKSWFPANTIQTFEIQNVDLNVPAIPQLTAQIVSATSQLKLSWPDWASGFNLYETTNLNFPTQWSPVTNDVQSNGGSLYLTKSLIGGGTGYFQLRKE